MRGAMISNQKSGRRLDRFWVLASEKAHLDFFPITKARPESIAHAPLYRLCLPAHRPHQPSKFLFAGYEGRLIQQPRCLKRFLVGLYFSPNTPPHRCGATKPSTPCRHKIGIRTSDRHQFAGVAGRRGPPVAAQRETLHARQRILGIAADGGLALGSDSGTNPIRYLRPNRQKPFAIPTAPATGPL